MASGCFDEDLDGHTNPVAKALASRIPGLSMVRSVLDAVSQHVLSTTIARLVNEELLSWRGAPW